MKPEDFKRAILLVVELGMGWDDEMIAKWYTTINPNFGNSSPYDLVIADRGHKVLNFVVSQIDQNFVRKTENSACSENKTGAESAS